LQAKAQHVADAIADAGPSATLLTTLAVIEAQINDIDQQLQMCASRPIPPTEEEVRDFVYRSILQLQELLVSNRTTLIVHYGAIR